MSRISVVVGGQFGSEGKGHVAAQLSLRSKVHVCARVAGPNAGHTAVAEDGTPWALRQVPCVAVTSLNTELVIAAGSEIDLEVVKDEVARLDEAGYGVSQRLRIDRQATLIGARHKALEVGMQERIGSTAKGIGAARADRLMRTADLYPGGIDTSRLMRECLADGGHVLIEGTQGYGLGLHAGWYPHCTSSDCRAVDFLAMCGLSPWTPGIDTQVWVVLRTFPIRVAGNSGPLRDETSWEQLGIESLGHIREERTTVTKKVRRVGRWDPDLARDAVVANGGPSPDVRVALTFFDYWFPELAGAKWVSDLDDEHLAVIRDVEMTTGSRVSLVTTGPDTAIWTP